MANHKESYALMWYECSCGARLRAWNSRDGVTPFGINCSSCGGIMRHVDWNKDDKAYAHKPFPGQVVFRDLSRLDAEEIAHQQLRARGIDPMTHERLEELIDSIYGDGKQPKVTYFRPDEHLSDNIKFAWEVWNSKTDWVQEAFNKNLLPVGLLGMHRADVLRLLCEPLLGWKAERLDEWEVRLTAPSGEAWRVRHATKMDGFNHFVWLLAQAMAERSSK